jgi:transcriptional regulator with XRE-family HTH domain
MDVTQVFADNIRALRLAQGISQEALADLAGLHRTYIGAVERGERNITLLNANRIADALGVPLSDCLKERHERKRKA